MFKNLELLIKTKVQRKKMNQDCHPFPFLPHTHALARTQLYNVHETTIKIKQKQNQIKEQKKITEQKAADKIIFFQTINFNFFK